ncbi:MAG: methyltransferase domain-containing protein [Cyanobacteriota bacterium]|nr:methyltransferase domain-containing protein [Cyanobacteriota bacterium]
MKVNCFVERNPIVETIIQHLADSPQTFKPKIAAADEMFLYQLNELEDRNFDRALVKYYSLGQTLFDSIQQIVNHYFGGFDQIDSFLDFACGYGRSTRFLVQKMPAEKVWVSDIYADAVKFQTDYFRVNGIISTQQPEDYPSEQKFDCIYAGSFFSHIPPETFKRWMHKLDHLLNPEGLLIFSVLDESILPASTPMPSPGILFSSETSESQTLDRKDYGTTYVNMTYIQQLIDQISLNQATIHRIEKGLGNYQDLYLITSKPHKNFTDFNFKYSPKGYLDECNITDFGEIQLSGWAMDYNRESQIEAVQIVVNHQVIQSCQVTDERPDLVEYFHTSKALNTGWQCVIDAGKIHPQDIIIIQAINTVGKAGIIAVDSVKNLKLRTWWREEFFKTRNTLKQQETQLHKAQSKLELSEYTLQQARDKLTQLEAELGQCQFQLESNQFLLEQSQTEITAMKSSKFWKLRTQWLQLRERIRQLVE